jgi:serine/threonine-protein kinase RsbT
MSPRDVFMPLAWGIAEMSEAIKLSYTVGGGDLIQAGEASSMLKLRLKKLGLPPELIRRVSVCMYEGEINMVIHANGGTVDVEIDLDAISMWLRDTGPGIPDIAQAMEEGYSTAGETARGLGFGAGMGLPNMKRNSDEMTVDSTVGVGTTVYMRIKINN